MFELPHDFSWKGHAFGRPSLYADYPSFVRLFTQTNHIMQTGALLRDWRRINVALTRAKHKLILIGSCDTLGHVPLLKSLLDILSSNNWIIDIPPNTQIT